MTAPELPSSKLPHTSESYEVGSGKADIEGEMLRPSPESSRPKQSLSHDDELCAQPTQREHLHSTTPDHVSNDCNLGASVGPDEVLPNDREITWGERLSPNAFWVFDHLQVAGDSEYLREMAKVEDVDFKAGLDELRELGLLDESDPKSMRIRWR